MGEGPGAGISDPPPGPGKPLGSSPFPHSRLAIGESRGRDMGTVTTGSLKFPSLAARRLKCDPMGIG